MRLCRQKRSSSSSTLLLLISVCVVVVSSSDFQHFTSGRIPNHHPHPFQGSWAYNRPPVSRPKSYRSHQHTLQHSETVHQNGYSTLPRDMFLPPVPQGVRNTHNSPRLAPASQQSYVQSPKKVKGAPGDLQPAGAAPYSVQIDFLDHPYHHPYHGPPSVHIDYHHDSKKAKKGWSKKSPPPPKGYHYEVVNKGHPPKYSNYGHHETYVHGPPPHSKGPVYYVDDGYHGHVAEHYSYGPKGIQESYPGGNPAGGPPPSPEAPKGPPPGPGPRDPSDGPPPSPEGGPFPDGPDDTNPSCNLNPELGERNITTPTDLDPTWFIVDDDRKRVDPYTVLNPPLVLVPPYPRQYSTDDLDDFETTFVERLSMDFEESARNAGFSVIRDRSSSLLNITSEIPPASSDSVTSVVTIKRTPKLDAPLRGEDDRYFQVGLERARAARERTDTRPPVENVFLQDLHAMTNLFQDLWNFEMDSEEIEVSLLSKHDAPNVLQMPMMVSRSERFSIPEPDHSERTVLDAAFNFGLQASRNQFESHAKLVDEWKQTMGVARSKFLASAEDLVEVYTGMSQFYDSLEDFARSRTVLQRNFGAESFIRAEEIAQTQFKAKQFLVCTDRDNDPNCLESNCVIDPITVENMRVDGRGGSGGGMRPARTRPARTS